MARELARWDPLGGLEALRRNLFDDGFLRTMRGTFPTTDMYTEEDGTLMVETHLPTFDDKDITVDVDRGAVVIQAEKHQKEEDKKRNYVTRESSSSYYRSIQLPDGAEENGITATFENGILKVAVPMAKAAAAPRKIAIGVGGSPASSPARATKAKTSKPVRKK